MTQITIYTSNKLKMVKVQTLNLLKTNFKTRRQMRQIICLIRLMTKIAINDMWQTKNSQI